MTRALSLLVALALLAVPSAAIAQQPQTNAPPGNSAIDEYLETVPGATGNRRPTPPGSGGGAATLPPAERARLERLGPDGKALADVVDATSPPRAASQKRTVEPTVAGPRRVVGCLERSGRDGAGEPCEGLPGGQTSRLCVKD